MNSTFFIESLVFVNNLTASTIESWFIRFDIFMIICITFVIISAIFFLCIIILDKTCHTVPMMLLANTCLVELVLGSDTLSMIIFKLQNDLKQIQYEDSFCVFRAVYRYITSVYLTRLFWQSDRTQIFLIGLTWIIAFLCPLPFILTVRYVRRMNRRVTPANTFFRARRELKMVRQIVILVIGVTTIGFPYAIFIFISFFTNPPKYHFRIAYIFINVSLVYVMTALFLFTDPPKASITKRIRRRPNLVVARVT